MHALLVSCLALAMAQSLLAASPSAAQVSQQSFAPDPAGYRELVDEGLREFDASNFDEARSLFLRAHALSPSARTHRALGLVEFELRQYAGSILHLKAALESKVKPLNEDQRSEVQRILARAYGFVCRLRVDVRPNAAEISLDGVPLDRPRAERLMLALGKHSLEVTAPGFKTEKRELAVDGGEERTLSFVLSPVESGSEKSAQQVADTKRWYKSPWLWAGVGVVVAGAAGGASYALLHQDQTPAASGGTSGKVLAAP